MKIFIAGARSITALDTYVQEKMLSIYHKGHEIIVGDCYGVDASVQKFYAALDYEKVTVFASNGRARNNIGRWPIEAVAVPASIRGFDFYRQKDIAMANEAEYGFMIWDGESRGTLNNIITMVSQHKPVLVYLSKQSKPIVVKTPEGITKLTEICGKTASALCADTLDRAVSPKQAQLTMTI